jgi:hypothetical protein
MLAMAHRDWLNRRQIANSKPIFGADLRKAVKVALLLDDLNESKRHKYVNKLSKFKDSKECASLSNAVFNQFCDREITYGCSE